MSQNSQDTGKPLSISNSGSENNTSSQRSSHFRIVGLEFAALMALLAVFVVGVGLYVAGRLPPYLVVFAGSIGALLALLAAFGLSLIGKLWKSFINKWQNSNHLFTVLASVLASLLALVIVYEIPYLLSDPYHHIARPVPVLNDPLLDNSSSFLWSEDTSSTSPCKFTPGGYQVTVPPKDTYHYCIADGTDFNNFVYEVQMTIPSGGCGGIVFRADLEHNKGYSFDICPDMKTYCLAHFDSSSKTDFLIGCDRDPILPSAVSKTLSSMPFIVIAVIADGTDFELRVNYQLVSKAFDPSEKELKQGQIGVLAGMVNSPNATTTVEFSNAKVWIL